MKVPEGCRKSKDRNYNGKKTKGNDQLNITVASLLAATLYQGNHVRNHKALEYRMNHHEIVLLQNYHFNNYNLYGGIISYNMKQDLFRNIAFRR